MWILLLKQANLFPNMIYKFDIKLALHFDIEQNKQLLLFLIFYDPVLVNHWNRQLADDTTFKIGICWQGNATRMHPSCLIKIFLRNSCNH